MKAASTLHIALPKMLVMWSIAIGAVLSLGSLAAVNYSNEPIIFGITLSKPVSPYAITGYACEAAIAGSSPHQNGWPVPYLQYRSPQGNVGCDTSLTAYLSLVALGLDLMFWSLVAGAVLVGIRRAAGWPADVLRKRLAWTALIGAPVLAVVYVGDWNWDRSVVTAHYGASGRSGCGSGARALPREFSMTPVWNGFQYSIETRSGNVATGTISFAGQIDEQSETPLSCDLR